MTGLINKVLSFTRHQRRQQVKPVAEPEVLEVRPLPMVGLFKCLTEEQQAQALRITEDERFGPDEFRRIKA